jgi:RNA polymerase sigma-70 factor (ECF subfamily)
MRSMRDTPEPPATPPSSGEQAASTFQAHRRRLVGLAYRLLGRMSEAQDVVQDAFVRWLSAERHDVRDPTAFLVTTVTRLSLDRLKSARAQREEYVGPWLPEPTITNEAARETLGALERHELLSIGLLRLLERLSPPERAVFVLREAFELTHEEIATTLGLETAHCRQLYGRARAHLPADRDRVVPGRDAHLRLLAEFLAATRSGDLDGLRALLHEDVVVWADGGGRVRAALKPVRGADRVARLFVGLAKKCPRDLAEARVARINGCPGLVIRIAGAVHSVSIEVDAGRIRNVYDVANPEKLAHLLGQLAEAGVGRTI